MRTKTCQVKGSSQALLFLHLEESLCVVKDTPLKKYIAISGRRILHEVENTAPWEGFKWAFQGTRHHLTHSEGTKRSWVGSYCPGQRVLQSWWGRKRFRRELRVASGRLASSGAKLFAGSGPRTVTRKQRNRSHSLSGRPFKLGSHLKTRVATPGWSEIEF